MKELNIEKRLKESADKIEMKEFSERWEVIRERIVDEREIGPKVPCAQKVAVTAVGGDNLHNNNTKKVSFAVGLCCLFLLIVMAIVLPLVLKKDNTKNYLALDELYSVNVTNEKFEAEINASGIKLLDFSNYNTVSHRLLYSSDGQLKGGYFDLADEECAVALTVLFHTDDVKTGIAFDADYKSTAVNSIKIDYETLENGMLFYSNILVNKDEIIYEMRCISSTDNIIPVFEKLFG